MRGTQSVLILMALFSTGFAEGVVAQPGFDWKVVNNFPFFKTQGALDLYMQRAGSSIGEGESVTSTLDRSMPDDFLDQVRRVNQPADINAIFHNKAVKIEVTWSGGGSGRCVLRQIDANFSSTVACSDGRAELDAEVGQPWRVSLVAESGVLQGNLSGVVRDLTLVGIGDSYASGEGNPDRPAVNTVHLSGHMSESGAVNFSALSGFGWTKTYLPNTSAEWLDAKCNRSIYSYQVMSAAYIAAKNPKTLVRFAHWSCTGAEVFDGLLFPQGITPKVDSAGLSQAGIPSQLDQLVSALCKTQTGRKVIDLSPYEKYRSIDPKQRVRHYNAMACPTGNLKKPDAILLSVGGNDVHFGRVVMHVLAPAGGGPLWREGGLRVISPMSPGEASEALQNGWLRQRYDILDSVLLAQFGDITAPMPSVFQLNYPNPLLRETGYCRTQGSLGTDSLAEVFSANGSRGWNITELEAKNTTKLVIEPLQLAVRANAARPGWVIVDGHLDEFKKHGFCSPENQDARRVEYNFPEVRIAGGGKAQWRNITPEDWKPYAQTARWIRMPNDSYLTQFNHRLGRLLPDDRRFLGTAHPNSWGHASFAQATAQRISKQIQIPSYQQ
ncbi:hypothetical protein FXN63_12690 [Pigmentiphaga aceris]|uniref:SGNH/GDSL hydrolase family protein n=1 Tax=Pigmentiphaga aceris TaxID=1940612 RepID=A0A5C0AYV4_9BURK|nr:hypothetical protein [Pigmentiphaga aceris]QEI06593.1 hypothetical protein FXN63_12690 [Pigmentiphaga aceris]